MGRDNLSLIVFLNMEKQMFVGSTWESEQSSWFPMADVLEKAARRSSAHTGAPPPSLTEVVVELDVYVTRANP